MINLFISSKILLFLSTYPLAYNEAKIYEEKPISFHLVTSIYIRNNARGNIKTNIYLIHLSRIRVCFNLKFGFGYLIASHIRVRIKSTSIRSATVFFPMQHVMSWSTGRLIDHNQIDGCKRRNRYGILRF